MIHITLPWDCLCSVNQRTNPVRGRQFLTKRYRKALKDSRWMVMAQVVQHHRPWSPNCSKLGDVEVGVIARFWKPDNRRRDANNYMKLVEDALVGDGRVIDDDSQIKDTRVSDMGIDRENPRCEVDVWELLPDETR